MSNINKTKRNLQVTTGLLVGYLIAGLTNMYLNQKTWQEAFSNEKIIMWIAGIGVSIFLFFRLKRNASSD